MQGLIFSINLFCCFRKKTYQNICLLEDHFDLTICIFVQTLKALGDICNCQNIVDVGAGQGHLSRYLTFQHGFKVTTVEAEGCHAPKAEKYDRSVEELIS